MASTFHVFRKNQKILLAVFGVLLMIAFTLAGVPELMKGPGSSQNPLLATSRYGDFHAFDVGELLDRRNVVKQFLYSAMLQANLQDWFDQMQRQFGGDLQKLLGPQAFQRMEARIGGQIEQMLMSTIGPTTERSVVQMRLQSSLAEREGIVIDDDAIAAFLRDQTNDRVTSDQMKAILQSISTRGKQRISKSYLFDAMRDELAAMKYRELFFMGIQSTPAERWDYYTRTKRRATVELVALPATDFLSEIKAPSQGELQAFFDQYKDDEPVPGSPTPGFKVPHEAAFAYFKADYKSFFDAVTVTEKEIEEYYEKNKDTKYLYSSVPEDDEAADESTPPEENKKSEDNKQPEEKKKPEGKAPETKPSDDKTEEPANKTPEEEKESSSSCGDEPEKSTDDPSGAGSPPDKDEKSEAETPSATDKPADNTPPADKDSAPPAEGATPNAPSLTPPANSPPAEKAPAVTPPATTPSATSTPATTTPSPSKEIPKSPPPLSDRYQLPTDIHGGKNPKYAPLWRVHDGIRKELAGSRAVAKMDGILLKLREELSGYTRKVGKAEYEKTQNPNAAVTEPAKPDFAALAKAAGVESGEIPRSPAYEVRNKPGLGQSIIGADPFASFAYQSLKVLTAVPAQDDDGNRYVFWKTEDIPAHVPDLAEIRSEVERAWKMIQARDPMQRKANELASEAREAKKSLKDTLGAKGYKVVETPAFSWLTSGTAGNFNSGAMPTLSEVEGVIDPGSDFMREVFGLRVGDVGVAENNPETVAYVVRPTSVEPSESVLRDTFMADKGGTQAQIQQAAYVDQRKLVEAWNKQLVTVTDLVWVQPPNDRQAVE